MRKLGAVVRWEFMRSVKSKQFIIVTIIIPLIIAATSAVPALVQRNQETRTLGLVDATGELAGLQAQLEPYRIELLPAEDDMSVQERLQQKGVVGVLARVSDADDSLFPYELFVEDADTDAGRVRSGLQSVLTDLAVEARVRDRGMTETELASLLEPVALPMTVVTEDGGEEAGFFFDILPLGLVVLLTLSGVMSGSVLMQSVIKEKQNRVGEILFSSTRASVIMQGKVIGFALLGLVQMAVWGGAAAVVLLILPDVGLPGIGVRSLLQSLPQFIAGFFMFSGLYAAVGAASPDAQSGGQTQGLVVLIPMLPVMMTGAIIMDPHAAWVKLLGLFPIMTPGVYLLRASVSVLPLWETALALGLSVLGAVFIMRVASRIFLYGMLRTGKPATIGEMTRWVLGR